MRKSDMRQTVHVHMTDIFHPHGDPDDHYDLALAFALHKSGLLDLECVLLDYPPAHRVGDPALCAVAQLNEISGSSVPAFVQPESVSLAGDRILRLLSESEKKVSFSVVGSAAYIASAISKNPALFQEKCAGIYLAAGTGIETEGGELEYNARLNPIAYSTALNAPCPLYWAPCYHTIRPGLDDRAGEYASVFCIHQREILNSLPPAMQNYFLYMLSRSSDPRYLRFLNEAVDSALLREFGDQKRRLWSAPLLLKAAGVSIETAEFLPVRIRAGNDGHVSWTKAEPCESDKYIFHIKNFNRETDHTFDTSGSYKEEMVHVLTEYYHLLG